MILEYIKMGTGNSLRDYFNNENNLRIGYKLSHNNFRSFNNFDFFYEKYVLTKHLFYVSYLEIDYINGYYEMDLFFQNKTYCSLMLR